MTQRNLLVFLVTAFALIALTAVSVSAFGDIAYVEVDGVPTTGGSSLHFSEDSGSKVPVLVVFRADAPAEDVRVKAWISGEKENAAVSERFDVYADTVYTRTVYVDLPADLDDNLNEERFLEIVVESRNEGVADELTISFNVQRESYTVEILSVNMNPNVQAGDPLAVDVVIKNRGSHFAEDTFVKLSIPELGLETRTYFGDLSPRDQDNPDKEDAVERRIFLRIPSNVPAGLYAVELEASNSDSFATATKRVLISATGDEATVVSAVGSKTFSVGETAEYKLTVVNRGNTVGVYEVVLDSSSSKLNLDVSEAIVVVPAGSSRTVSIFASSEEEGEYSFTANVHSESGELLGENTFRANVESNGKTSGTANATVLLTVILAIVFIVLLVVLIVLLTRKPETKEEFGESYY